MHLYIFNLNPQRNHYTIIDEDEVKHFDNLRNLLPLYSVVLLGYTEKITRNEVHDSEIIYFPSIDPKHYEFVTLCPFSIFIHDKLDKLRERISQDRFKQYILLSFNHSIRNVINDAIQHNHDRLKAIYNYLEYVIANSKLDKAIEVCEKYKNYLAVSLL